MEEEEEASKNATKTELNDSSELNEDNFKIEDVLEPINDVYDCSHCGEVFSTLAEVEGHIRIEHEYIIDVGVVDSNAITDGEIKNSENNEPEESDHSENDLNQTTDAEIINSESNVYEKNAHFAEPMKKSQTLISKSNGNSTKRLQNGKRKLDDSFKGVSNSEKYRKIHSEGKMLLPALEGLCLRFPLISDQIWDSLDNQSFIKVLESSKEIYLHLKETPLYWKKILRCYNGNFVNFQESWNKVIKAPVEIVKQLATEAQVFFKSFPLSFELQHSPFIIAVNSGNLYLCEFIAEKIGIRNLKKTKVLDNALLQASSQGNIEICKFIMKNLENKNPGDDEGVTPLHVAARCGKEDVCRFLMDNLVDKNPQANDGITPLHEAASYGCLDVCKLFIKYRDVTMGKFFLKYVGNKNPSDNSGQTPLHYAANGGHLEVCKLLIENTTEKNPRDPSGWTPLHLAAQSGHIKVCQLITQHVLDRNPVADDGSTPHSLMIKAANNLFLPLS